MIKLKHLTRIALLSPIVASNLSCRSASKDLAYRTESISELAKIQQQPTQHITLNWADIQQQLPQSPTMLSAKHRLEQVEWRESALWRSLLPDLRIRTVRSTNFEFENLLSASALRHEALLNVFLTRYINLPSRLYGIHMMQSRAFYAARTEQKALLLSIWELGVEQQMLKDEAAHLEKILLFWEQYKLPTSTAEKSHDALISIKLRLHQKSLRLGQLIGMHGWSVEANTEDWPDWLAQAEAYLANHVPEIPHESDPDWIALLALEWLAAEARQRQITLEFWPDLDGYLNLPFVNLDQVSDTDWDNTSITALATFRPFRVMQTIEDAAQAQANTALVAMQLEEKIAAYLQPWRITPMQLSELDAQINESQTRLERLDAMIAQGIPPEQWTQVAEQRQQWLNNLSKLHADRQRHLIELWALTADASEHLLQTEGAPCDE